MDGETKPDTETAVLVEQGERLFEAGKPAEALRVFEQAVVRAPLSATVYCNLGAVRWALGWVEEALAGFRRALELAPDHLEAALNLARALTAMGRREEAALVARGFLALRPDAEGFREFVAGAEGLRQQSVPAAGTRRLRVAIFSREPDWAALRLRLSAPLGALPEEIDLIWARRGNETEAWFDADCIDECDVVVVQRLFASPETSALCRRIFSSGRPVVYELDDDFLDVPDTHPFYDMIKGYQPFVLEMLRLSDTVTVTSTALAERVRPYNPQVHVLPNALEFELWRGGRTPVEKSVDGPVVIGFAGTATHKADLALVSEALRRIRAEYGDRVAFRFLGCAPPGLEGVCEVRPFELRYGAYVEVLAHSGIDIALAPLVDDPFNRCKSDIKWLEYSACGFAGVYSDLGVYRDSVFDGETGLLVENRTEAWFEAIDRLVHDPALRRRIGQAARAQVLATRTVEAVAPRYLEVYRRVARSPRRAIREGWHIVGDYEVWRDRNVLPRSRGDCQPARTPEVSTRIHLVIAAPAAALSGLSATLDSLVAQEYAASHLTVVSRAPRPDPLAGGPPGLDWVQVEGGLMEGVNRLVQASSAEWIGLLDAGDLVEPDMLSRCVDFLRDRPEDRLIYMDEDRIDAAGGHHDPQFKPDFNLELLRSMPYMGRCLLVRRDALNAAGGYAADERVAAYELALRVSEAEGARAIGHIPWVLVHHQDRFRRAHNGEEVGALCRRALADHLARAGIDAVIRDGSLAGTFFVDYAVPADTPQVEIFVDGNVPTQVLSMCLEHLIGKTDYPALRINLLVPEGWEPGCPEALHERVALLPYDVRQGRRPMIEARIDATDAPYLLFLRAGVIVLQGNWFARLLGPMQRGEVAATAPRLVSTDNRVVDGGILLGGGGYSVGAVAHSGLALDAPGYMGRAQVAQELGAVTDNCLLIRADAYRAAGGFSPTIETPLYRAVDLCRRVSAGGGVIVWTPHATLLYVEAVAGEAGRLARERAAEREAPVVCGRWLPELARDSAYNPNLSLHTADFRVPENLPSPAAFDSSRPRILGFGATSFGSWKYRVDQPLDALHREGLAHRFLIDFQENGIAQLPTVAELERLEVDALLFHNAVHDYALDALRLYREANHAFVVLGEDDLMTALPPKNPYSKTVYKDIRRRLRRACELADRLVVTTEPLAEALRRYNDNIWVVPNGLPTEIWETLRQARRRRARPRVGWAGAPQHHGDLELLREVVEATAREVDWVFFGMCPDFLRTHVREIHDPVSFDAYPGKLASLELDLALAPLELNDFNRCKSNLRLLEYGVLGWPVIASDIEPYRDAPVCRVRNQARAWIQAIRDRIHDSDAAWREGDQLREWVRTHGMLEDHLDRWLSVLHPEGGVALTPQAAMAGGGAPEASVAPRPDSVAR